MKTSHRDELITKLIKRTRVSNVLAFNTYSSSLRQRTSVMETICLAKPSFTVRFSLVSNSKEDILQEMHRAMSNLRPNTRWYCAFEAPTEYNYDSKVLRDIELLIIELLTWMLDIAHLLKLTLVFHGIIPKEIESVVKQYENSFEAGLVGS